MLSVADFCMSLSSVSLWGFAGTLARVGLDWCLVATISVLAPNDSPIGVDFLSNMVGCIVLGALDRFSELKQGRFKWVYLGLTSGFCGCLTTFSGWQVQAAQSFLRQHFMASFLNLIAGLATFYSCFLFGQLVSDIFSAFCLSKRGTRGTDALIDSQPQNPPSDPPRPISVLNIAASIASIALWIVFGILFIFVSRSRHWVGPAILTPFGVGLRWYTSRWNAKYPKFKLYTFMVNQLGVLIYAIVLVCATKFDSPQNSVRSAILAAIITGFCGALTTTSTLISELHHIGDKRFSVLYFLASVIVAQILALVVLAVAKFGAHIGKL